MKDLIDKRNEREKIQKSIIKSWNVNYVQNQQPSADDEQPEKDSDCMASEYGQKAGGADFGQDLYEKHKDAYNESTGAYSGLYGQEEVTGVTKGQIDKILQEKEEVLRTIIESGENRK